VITWPATTSIKLSRRDKQRRTYVKNVLANATYYSLLMDGKSSTIKQRLGTIQPKTAVLSELP